MVALKSLLILLFAYLIYSMSLERHDIAHFVPYNSYEVPKNLSDKQWQQLNDKFGTLIQTINTTEYAVGYHLDNMMEALLTVINGTGLGTFTILSVGNSTPLSLTDVLVQDVTTLAVTRFSKVDFIVHANNPFVISKVIITPDKQYISSQNILPKDALQPSVFRIPNCMHQFHPYQTSDDDMKLSPVDVKMFSDTMKEKAQELNSIESQNSIPIGTVAHMSAMALPSADQMNKEIVGAGPLHPIGL